MKKMEKGSAEKFPVSVSVTAPRKRRATNDTPISSDAVRHGDEWRAFSCEAPTWSALHCPLVRNSPNSAACDGMFPCYLEPYRLEWKGERRGKK